MKKIDTIQTSLIICTFNRSEDLYRCLNYILKLGKKFDEIIIVEQGNVSETKKIIQKFDTLDIVLYYYSIRSLAQARNFGLQKANGEFLYFIDDDTQLISADYVKISLDYFNKHPEVMGLCGEIIHNNRKTRSALNPIEIINRLFLLCLQNPLNNNNNRVLPSGRCIRRSGSKDNHHFVQWLPGCNMVYRKKVFDEGLMFNPNFLRWSAGEDIMLSYQVYKKYGAQSLHYIPEFRIIHHTSPEISMKPNSHIRMEVIYRFIFWHCEVYQGSFCQKIQFFIFQIHTIMRIFNDGEVESKYAYVKNIWLSYRYLYKNWNKIANNNIDYNSFIFSEDQII